MKENVEFGLKKIRKFISSYTLTTLLLHTFSFDDTIVIPPGTPFQTFDNFYCPASWQVCSQLYLSSLSAASQQPLNSLSTASQQPLSYLVILSEHKILFSDNLTTVPTSLLKWQSGRKFDPRTGKLHIVRDPLGIPKIPWTCSESSIWGRYSHFFDL